MKTPENGKWPASLTLIRHDVSAYNDLKPTKEQDPLYQDFVSLYKKESNQTRFRPSPLLLDLAEQISDRYSLNISNRNTPLAPDPTHRAHKAARALSQLIPTPDVVFSSTFIRTQQTRDRFITGWPELASVKHVTDYRIVEQNMGLLTLYNDRKVFHVFHPEQLSLQKQEGNFEYRYPQGENIPDVMHRAHAWVDTLIREYANLHVVAFTHHLFILAFRCLIERITNEAEFVRLDDKEKPINCGVTIYRQDPRQGKQGRLVLTDYNRKLY